MKEMTPRERVLTALRHEEPDRVPLDLGGMQGPLISPDLYREMVKPVWSNRTPGTPWLSATKGSSWNRGGSFSSAQGKLFWSTSTSAKAIWASEEIRPRCKHSFCKWNNMFLILFRLQRHT
jgi:hypothetical protein